MQKDYNSFEKRLRRDFSIQHRKLFDRKALLELGLFTAQCFSRSEPQTYVTNANSIDGGPNIVHRHRPISPRHAIMHCVPLYCIQPLYSHYTATIHAATIQPEEVMSEAWGLYVGAPAERSGESDKWEYAERILYNGSRMVRW